MGGGGEYQEYLLPLLEVEDLLLPDEEILRLFWKKLYPKENVFGRESDPCASPWAHIKSE